MESDLRAWAAQHPHRVRFFTAVPHEDVPDYLRAADVLIAPSQTNRPGASNWGACFSKVRNRIGRGRLRLWRDSLRHRRCWYRRAGSRRVCLV